MRHRKPRATAGQIRRRRLLTRQHLVLAGAGLVAVWIVVTFAQEALLSHQLDLEVASLQQQNAQLRLANTAAQRRVLALASGSGFEEQARLNGYARPGERVFFVTPPTPAPKPVRQTHSEGAQLVTQVTTVKETPAHIR